MLVVIVGAGPTGLIAANLLGNAGIPTLLLERNAGLSTIPRAITIDDEGMRICQACGLQQALSEQLLLDVQAHYISRGQYLARVAPQEKRNGHPFISTFHQPELEATLLVGLARFPNVDVRFAHTVTDLHQHEQGVRLVVSMTDETLEQIECDYVLACDGSKSSLRRLLVEYPTSGSLKGPCLQPSAPLSIVHATSTSDKAPGIALVPINRNDLFAHTRPGRGNKPVARRREQTERWLVVDCIDDDDPSLIVLFFCNPARPAVTVPAPGGRRRWEFMLMPGEDAHSLQQDEIIHSLIKQARITQPVSMQGKFGTGRYEIMRKTIYTFHSTLATIFSSRRVFLLGDAAHLMPPFGGQGMNSGLRDAHNLCWKLTLVLQDKAHTHILESYEQERRPHVAQMILFSSLLGKLVMPISLFPALLRDIFFRTITRIPPINELISEMRVKPQPRYRQGCLLPSMNKPGKKLIGSLLPQPDVTTPEGMRVLLDEVLGTGFTLLRLHPDPGLAFAGLNGEVWGRLAVRYVCILPAGSTMPENSAASEQCRYVMDDNDILGTYFQHNSEIYVLVRPDCYIMGVFWASQTQVSARELGKLFA